MGFVSVNPSQIDVKGLWPSQKLILIFGKGGVGKSYLAHQIAQKFLEEGESVFLGTTSPKPGTKLKPYETFLDPERCFQEYIELKLSSKTLAQVFLSSKVIKYLQKSAPGIKEIVTLGKVWFETTRHDRVIVDLPSTGHALSVFFAPAHFSELFPEGPMGTDARNMSLALNDQKHTSFLGVCLPEEMPLEELREAQEKILRIYNKNPVFKILNKAPSIDELNSLSNLNDHFHDQGSDLPWLNLCLNQIKSQFETIKNSPFDLYLREQRS